MSGPIIALDGRYWELIHIMTRNQRWNYRTLAIIESVIAIGFIVAFCAVVF